MINFHNLMRQLQRIMMYHLRIIYDICFKTFNAQILNGIFVNKYRILPFTRIILLHFLRNRFIVHQYIIHNAVSAVFNQSAHVH